jgi:hypothetical protein
MMIFSYFFASFGFSVYRLLTKKLLTQSTVQTGTAGGRYHSGNREGLDRGGRHEIIQLYIVCEFQGAAGRVHPSPGDRFYSAFGICCAGPASYLSLSPRRRTNAPPGRQVRSPTIINK